MVCLLVFCLVYHFFCRLICHPAQLQSVQIRNWTPSDLFILGSDSETFFRIFNSIQNLIGLNSQLKIKFSTSETSGGWAPKKMNADLIFICHLFLPRVEAPFTDKFCDLGHELEINIDQ